MWKCWKNCWMMVLQFFVVCGPSAYGLIMNVGDFQMNQTLLEETPGFENVGRYGGCTGVYVGDRWVLTAQHVGGKSIVLNDTVYTVAEGDQYNINGADLKLVRLVKDPGLSALRIATCRPVYGERVVLIGCGKVAGEREMWGVEAESMDNKSDWKWQKISRGKAGRFNIDIERMQREQKCVIIEGYPWSTEKEKLWGYARYVGASVLNDNGKTVALKTSYEPGLERGVLQAAGSDSGGALLREGRGGWELSGIMVRVNSFKYQPKETSMVHDGILTYSVDLSAYRDTIVDIMERSKDSGLVRAQGIFGEGGSVVEDILIPEPQSCLLLASVVAVLVVCYRRFYQLKD